LNIGKTFLTIPLTCNFICWDCVLCSVACVTGWLLFVYCILWSVWQGDCCLCVVYCGLCKRVIVVCVLCSVVCVTGWLLFVCCALWPVWQGDCCLCVVHCGLCDRVIIVCVLCSVVCVTGWLLFVVQCGLCDRVIVCLLCSVVCVTGWLLFVCCILWSVWQGDCCLFVVQCGLCDWVIVVLCCAVRSVWKAARSSQQLHRPHYVLHLPWLSRCGLWNFLRNMAVVLRIKNSLYCLFIISFYLNCTVWT
jgi:hypothetical protein